MVLESTIVCVDNSEYSRNGDFAPTRFDVQNDSINLICTTKLDSHPENTVGLLSSAGKSARILVTSTQDVGRILAALHNVKFDGESNVSAAIQKAQLALKHRQNQAQRQRIVLFISSPVKDDKESLVKLGKKLKKNNVALDVVNVGEEGTTVEKIDALIEAVNSSNNSHALHAQAGPRILADLLLSSDIMVDREAADAGGGGGPATAAGPGGGASANDFPFGVDPSLEPELAMALRISAEEERARQERERGQSGSGGADNAGGEAAASSDNAASESGAANETNEEGGVSAAMADDADLYGTDDKMEIENAGGESADKEKDAEGDDDEEMDESMRAAIALSKEEYKEDNENKK